MRQKFEESLWDYVERAEALVSRLPPSNMSTAGMQVLGGISEGQFKEILKIECYKETDFSIKNIKRLIKTAQELEEPRFQANGQGIRQEQPGIGVRNLGLQMGISKALQDYIDDDSEEWLDPQIE